jgi:hypothetical protein
MTYTNSIGIAYNHIDKFLYDIDRRKIIPRENRTLRLLVYKIHVFTGVFR